MLAVTLLAAFTAQSLLASNEASEPNEKTVTSEVSAPPDSFHIAVFTPTTEVNTYWPEVHSVMRAAADSLDLEVTFHEFDVGDRFTRAERGPRILRRDPRPDAAVFSVAFGQTMPLVETAEALDIPFFLNGPLFPEEMEELGGEPRNEYANWIGYFQEDEEHKGYLLARLLIEAARDRHDAGRGGTVRLAGVSGDPLWHGTSLRETGFRKAIAEHAGAALTQIVPTRWTPAEGREMARRLQQRYPDVDAVWAASDQLALGVTEADADVITGGLDLSRAGLEAVREGTLTATVAASPLIWAEVLIHLHDYLRGVDFRDRVGTQMYFQPDVATESNAEDIIKERENYKTIDFRRYSRYYRGDEAEQFLLHEES